MKHKPQSCASPNRGSASMQNLLPVTAALSRIRHGLLASLLLLTGASFLPPGQAIAQGMECSNIWNVLGDPGVSPGNYTLGIAMSNAGVPHIISTPGYGPMTAMKYSGGSWSVVGSSGFASVVGGLYCMAFDASDNLWVAHQDQGAGNRLSVRRFNGSSWVAVGTSLSSGPMGDPGLAIYPGGTALVVYRDYNSGNRLMYTTYNGSTWTSGGFVSTNSGWDPKVRQNSSGVPYLVYGDGAAGGRATLKRFVSGAWETVSTGFSLGGASNVCMEFDASGNIWCSYQNYSNEGRMDVMKYDGSSWTVVGNGITPPASGLSVRTALAIGADNLPYMAYYRANYPLGNFVNVLKYNGSSWNAVGGTDFRASTGDFGLVMDKTTNIPYLMHGDPAYSGNATVRKLGSATLMPVTGAAPLCEGGTLYLSSPTGGGVWWSGNPAIATVANGTVTGVLYGTATITYGLSQDCISTAGIEVTPLPSNPITGTDHINVSSSTTLTHPVEGGTWVSSNPAVATVNTSGTVTGAAPGTVTISYTSSNFCATGATVTHNMHVYPAGTVVCSPQWDLLGEVASPFGSVYEYAMKSDASGTPYVVYGDNGDNRANVKKFVNGAWQTVGDPSFSAMHIEDPAITIESTVYVAYTDHGNDARATVKKLNGDTWETLGTEGFSDDYMEKIAIAVAGDIPYVAYRTYPNLIVKRFTDGEWQSVVSPIEGYVNNWALTAHDGAVYIAYEDYGLPGTQLVVKKYVGGEWVSVGESIPSGGGGIISMEISAAGNIYVSFRDYIGTGKMAVYKYEGTEWLQVGSSDATTSSPSEFAHFGLAGEVPFVAYANSDVYPAKLEVTKFDGDSWELVGDLSSIETPSYYPVFITVPATGRPIVCYTDANTGYPAFIKYNAGTLLPMHPGTIAVGGTETLNPGETGGTWSSSNTDIATVSADGVVTGIAAGTAEITYLHYTGCETTVTVTIGSTGAPSACADAWTAVGGKGFTANDYFNEIAINSSGDIYVVYANNSSLSAKKYNGSTWEAAGAAGFGNVAGGGMCTAFDPSGNLWVAHQNFGAGGNKIAVKKLVGGSWATVSAGISSGAAGDPSMVIAPDGTVFVAYREFSAGHKAVVKKYNGSAWTTVGPGSYVTTTSAHEEKLVLSSTGELYLFYQDGGAGYKATLKKFNGTNWEHVGTQGFTPGVATNISLQLDASGAPWVAFRDLDHELSVSVMKYSGGSWSVVSENVSPANSSYSAPVNMRIGSDNKAYLLYNSFDKVNVVRYDDTGWTRLMPENFWQGTTYMSMALDATNTPWVAYNEPSPADMLTVRKPGGGPVAAVTGAGSICFGQSLSLSSATTEGLWISSNTEVATVQQDGVVSSVAAGTAKITYGLSPTCKSVAVVTVTAISPIMGATSLCKETESILEHADAGGAWSSSNEGTVTVNSEGILTGVNGGWADITYTMPGGCIAVTQVTVNAPVLYVSHGATICSGSSTTMEAYGASSYSWAPASSLSSATGESVVASPTVTTVYTVTGSDEAGCFSTRTITIEANPTPSAITGTFTVAVGSTTDLDATPEGGEWWSSDNDIAYAQMFTGIINGNSAGTANITYIMPTGCSTIAQVTVNGTAAITGPDALCIGVPASFSCAITGGTWSTSASAVATVNAATGEVTGIAGGTVIISYQTGASSYVTKTVTVLSTAPSISGALSLCVGSASALSATPSGGTWSSSDETIASINGETGTVTGGAAGQANITYSTGGCYTVRTVTVNAIAGITGDAAVCLGGSITLSTTATGGTWTSSAPSKAAVAGGSGIVTAVSAGEATITYATGPACYATRVISVNAAPEAITGAATVCANNSTALSHSTSGGTWSSSNTGTATVGSTGIVTGIAAGTTMITYRTSAGCFRTHALSVNPAPAAIAGTASMCAGSSATLTSTGGGTWSSSDADVASVPATPGIVAGVSAGNAVITFRLTATGCYTTRIVTVHAMPAAISGSNTICVGSSQGYTSATEGGTWTSTTVGVAGMTSVAGSFSGNSVGTSTIVYAVNGCLASKVVSVVALPATISGATTMCQGSTTTLTSTTAGQVWSSNNGSIATVATATSTTGLVTGISAGTTTISYTNANGCTRTIAVSVAPAVPGISGTGEVCIGGQIPLSNTLGGGTWSSSSAAATISGAGIVTGVSTGLATITYRTSATCFTTKTVNVIAAPSASITGPTSACVGGSVTLNHPVADGTWSIGVAGKATVGPSSGVVTAIATGTTVVTYNTSASCFRTVVFTVTAAPAAIGGSATAICEGATTTFTTTTPGGSWVSSNGFATVGSSSGVVTGVSAGVATISYVLPSAGCYATRNITVNALPSAISGTGPVCAGSTRALSSTPSGGTWSSSTTTAATIGTSGIVTGVNAGTSTISYTLGTGCRRTTVATVNGIPGTISGTLSMCQGSTTSLTATNAGLSWISSNGSIATVGSTSAIAGLVTGVGTGTATISYVNAAGCARTVIVTVNAGPAAIAGDNTLCIGGNITLTNTVSGGTWSSSSSAATVGASSGIVTGVSAATATITYRTSATCFVTKTVTVTTAPATAITGPTTTCIGSSITLAHATTGGTWSSSNTVRATVSPLGVVTGVTAGTLTITYTLSGGCYKTAVITVMPGVTPIDAPASMCVNTFAGISNATAGGTWSVSNPARAILAYSGPDWSIHAQAIAGVVTITYQISSTGCFVTKDVTINAKPAITNYLVTANVCANASIPFIVSPTGGTWSTNAGITATVNATGMVTGIAPGYTTINYVEPINGCRASRTVTVHPLPAAITGTAVVNELSTTTLACATPGGNWYSSNSTIATVGLTTGEVTGQLTGNATITYSLAGTLCYRTRVVTVNPFGSRGAASVGQGNTGIRIFPNPSSGSLTVETVANGTFTIYTIDGKKVEQYAVAAPATSVALPAGLAAGVYMCKFEGEDGSNANVQIVFTP